MSGQNKKRNLKLSQCCFLANISPHTKFYPNWTKNTEVENFRYWSVLVGRAGRSKNGRSHFKHSESVQRLTNDLCTKFKPNRTKVSIYGILSRFDLLSDHSAPMAPQSLSVSVTSGLLSLFLSPDVTGLRRLCTAISAAFAGCLCMRIPALKK